MDCMQRNLSIKEVDLCQSWFLSSETSAIC